MREYVQCAYLALGLADGRYLINGGNYCHHCVLESQRTQWTSSVTVFSPPYSERAHCLDPPQLQRKAGLHNTYYFSSSWGNMSNWFQKGRNSELSCSNVCAGEEGGTITPGGLNCVSVFCFLERTQGGLSFWKRNHENYLKHAYPSSSALLRLHNEGHHILPSFAPQSSCWIQTTWRLAVLLGFFPQKVINLFTEQTEQIFIG